MNHLFIFEYCAYCIVYIGTVEKRSLVTTAQCIGILALTITPLKNQVCMNRTRKRRARPDRCFPGKIANSSFAVHSSTKTLQNAPKSIFSNSHVRDDHFQPPSDYSNESLLSLHLSPLYFSLARPSHLLLCTAKHHYWSLPKHKLKIYPVVICFAVPSIIWERVGGVWQLLSAREEALEQEVESRTFTRNKKTCHNYLWL